MTITAAITKMPLPAELSHGGIACVVVPELALICKFIPVKMLCGISVIPPSSTLQYSSELFAPGVVMYGCPLDATDLVGPLLIL